MQDVFAALDNREKAIIIWVAFFLISVLTMRGVPFSLSSILRITLSRPVLVVLVAMVIYVSSLVFFAHGLGLWDFSLMKDTLIWLLGPALIMVFNSAEANRDARDVRQT